MEGHLLAAMLDGDAPQYPFLALLVSGGHTMLVSVAGVGCYDVLGSTLDDAAGEAFDKTAKLLGLDYPGGPLLAKLAENGSPTAFDLPRPMISRSGFDFSFSGLKTAVMLKVRAATEEGDLDAVRADIAASFQQAVVDTLVSRTLKAADHLGVDRLVIAGGVGANRALRDELKNRFRGRVFYPRIEYCTDNGAMIAMAGAMRLSEADTPIEIKAVARWPLQNLLPPAETRTAYE
jgi:N6-L-threonylcarbamoyladenine synthase